MFAIYSTGTRDCFLSLGSLRTFPLRKQWTSHIFFWRLKAKSAKKKKKKSRSAICATRSRQPLQSHWINPFAPVKVPASLRSSLLLLFPPLFRRRLGSWFARQPRSFPCFDSHFFSDYGRRFPHVDRNFSGCTIQRLDLNVFFCFFFCFCRVRLVI